jgi:hypothetical protein
VVMTVWSRVCREDLLLSSSVLDLISSIHGEIVRVDRHVCVNRGLEVDAVIVTRRVRERLIGVELKEVDILKAVKQAVARRPFFHYFYIVNTYYTTRHRALGHFIETLYRNNLLGEIFRHKIGWILVDKSGEAHLIYPSRYSKVERNSVLLLNHSCG